MFCCQCACCDCYGLDVEDRMLRDEGFRWPLMWCHGLGVVSAVDSIKLLLMLNVVYGIRLSCFSFVLWLRLWVFRWPVAQNKWFFGLFVKHVCNASGGLLLKYPIKSKRKENECSTR